ncbi:DMT family transporter [Paenibacillus sediminis]|uniref:Drug/metabolite transporter (DMT)-like permease n=1 Tax=Paenibacillus sediminis TaxID=664909 RepID=A0ABS4H1D2_9BACL|nr:DMT family transporter [Paenibacillus sediminis]MBP1936082.1 drug/metabolite transporter (DMT)-like permease [Paenibacillus sediminis]
MKLRYWLFLLLCNLLWAGNMVTGKYVVTEFTPLWITFLRWAISIVILFPIAHFYEKPDWKMVIKQSWLKLAFMGILGIVLFNILTYSALKYTSSTNASLVSALNPAIIMILSVFLLKERMTFVQIMGLIISFFGVVVILTQGNPLQILYTNYNKGDLLMLGVDLSWAVYSIMGKKMTGVPPITATAISSCIGVLMMLPFLFNEPLQFNKITTHGIAGIVYIALFASVCAFVLWNISVRSLGAGKASISLNLIPIYTAVINLLLGKHLDQAQIWGGLIVLAGMLLTSNIFKQKREAVNFTIPKVHQAK